MSSFDELRKNNQKLGEIVNGGISVDNLSDDIKLGNIDTAYISMTSGVTVTRNFSPGIDVWERLHIAISTDSVFTPANNSYFTWKIKVPMDNGSYSFIYGSIFPLETETVYVVEVDNIPKAGEDLVLELTYANTSASSSNVAIEGWFMNKKQVV